MKKTARPLDFFKKLCYTVLSIKMYKYVKNRKDRK